MREHMGLYRGKRIDNGEWVAGTLILWRNGDAEICVAATEFADEMNKYLVAPDTVGECTGLRDKNGKLIFEGDIISIRFEGDYEPPSAPDVWYANAKVIWQAEHLGWYANFGGYDELSMWEYDNPDDVVVIGNIHDNPELLKGGEGDD